jgi:hypothetical protein
MTMKKLEILSWIPHLRRHQPRLLECPPAQGRWQCMLGLLIQRMKLGGPILKGMDMVVKLESRPRFIGIRNVFIFCEKGQT